MKRLETTQTKVTSFFTRVRYAVTTSVSSLLTSTRMFISVGFAIIGVVILGALLGVLVRLYNYKNGTQLQTGPILKGFADLFSTHEHREDPPKVELPKEFTKPVFC